MINKDLNDDEIQQYVLQKEACDIDIIKHVGNCEICKIKAEQYNQLFEGVQQQEKPAFDFDLADFVIKQLPQSRYEASNDNLFYYLIIFISAFFFSIVFYFFRDSLLNLFKGITLILSATIITTVTSLFIFLCIDMYRKYQTQIKTLNFY